MRKHFFAFKTFWQRCSACSTILTWRRFLRLEDQLKFVWFLKHFKSIVLFRTLLLCVTAQCPQRFQRWQFLWTQQQPQGKTRIELYSRTRGQGLPALDRYQTSTIPAMASSPKLSFSDICRPSLWRTLYLRLVRIRSASNFTPPPPCSDLSNNFWNGTWKVRQ